MIGIEKAPAHLRVMIERDPDISRVIAAVEDDRVAPLAAVTVADQDGDPEILIFNDGELLEREPAQSAEPAIEAHAWLLDIVEEYLG